MLKLTRWPSVGLFLLAGLSAAVFAFVTANLFSHAMANIEFLRDYGWIAVQNGALVQIAELMIWSSMSMACWIIFKICEQILEDRYLAWSEKR